MIARGVRPAATAEPRDSTRDTAVAARLNDRRPLLISADDDTIVRYREYKRKITWAPRIAVRSAPAECGEQAGEGEHDAYGPPEVVCHLRAEHVDLGVHTLGERLDFRVDTPGEPLDFCIQTYSNRLDLFIQTYTKRLDFCIETGTKRLDFFIQTDTKRLDFGVQTCAKPVDLGIEACTNPIDFGIQAHTKPVDFAVQMPAHLREFTESIGLFVHSTL